ncbi:amidohydrolase family protein [Haloarchaeobius sp. HRN-SO-5]|uniref:amidohydrolase family protein n=1 Tax=Haloarchaeobius sp. HRN-SO-5 TaxID=3446118 RepID=UPI003EBD292E
MTTQHYDLVISGGRVIDPETMLDAVKNVGVSDGRIEAITTDDISGDETIDATGLVVAPGFIDTHFHAVDPFATKLALRDGTTTGMDLELGALHVGDWYEQKATGGWQVNYGTTASLNFARLAVHDPEVDIEEPIDFSNGPSYLNESAEDGVQGWSVTRSDVEQMNQVMELLDEDLRQGALGVGVGAAYMARGMTSYEQFEAQRTAARYDRLTSVHTRYHLSSQTPTEAPIGLDEVLTNAMLLDAPLILCHDNDYGWWENEEKLRLAREKGYNVWGEHYPYDAGSTVVSADFLRPEVWEETYGNVYEETIYDPVRDSFLDKEAYENLVEEDPGHTIVVFFPTRNRWMSYWLQIPHMTVATDAMAGVGDDGELLPWDADYESYAGHPRTAGAMAKTLRLGREHDVPLMFSLAQLSYWTAKHLGDAGIDDMKERGRVQVGAVADLTLFDPETVTDNSTYKHGENGLPSTGIPYVVVNGTVVVEDSEVLPVKPGQPIRYPIEDEGRFVPIDTREWIEEHTIGAGAMPRTDDTGAGTVMPEDEDIELPNSTREE